MNILHISDLHYKGTFSKVFNQMLEKIKEEKIDLCLFSGDLIDQGGYPLEKAYNDFKLELKKVGIEKLVITCGNHDIDRNAIQPMFQEYIEKKNSKEISEFVKEDKAQQFRNNLTHISEYNELIAKEFSEHSLDSLYHLYTYELDEKKISIVSLNSSWGAFESKTYGEVLFPNHLLDEINSKIKNSDFKILLTHFHYKFFKQDCQLEFSKKMRDYFDCVFLGHSHQNEENNYVYSDTGIFMSISGSLTSGEREGYTGFKIVKINCDNYEAIVDNYEYTSLGYKTVSSNYEIPCDKKKKNK